MTGRYASKTEVPQDRTRSEIEAVIRRYGATEFAYAWREGHAVVGFVANGRQIRFLMPLPDRGARTFTQTPTGKVRARASADAEYEQAVRTMWRSLNLVVKAKLEAVESGLVTFETEFMPYTVLPDGRTVAEHAEPAIREAYETGTMRPLVPAYPPALESGEGR